jgi:flagellar motility protein MotE (MotC chaperone)
MKPRLLPLLIVIAALSFLIKAGGVWQGLEALAEGEKAGAEDGAAATPTTPPGRLAGRDAASEERVETAAAPQQGAAAKVPPVSADLAGDPFALTDEEIELLQMLAQRRAEIDRREAELEQRSTLLEAAERRIDEKISALETLRKAIEELLIRREEQEEAQLNSLVKIYENMKPKDAARIFEELDMAVLLDVIERMKERKTAPILAQMNPKRAKAITLELAQRRGFPHKSN